MIVLPEIDEAPHPHFPVATSASGSGLEPVTSNIPEKCDNVEETHKRNGFAVPDVDTTPVRRNSGEERAGEINESPETPTVATNEQKPRRMDPVSRILVLVMNIS